MRNALVYLLLFTASPCFAHVSLAPIVERVMGGIVNIRTSDVASQNTTAVPQDPFMSLFLKSSEKMNHSGIPSRSMGTGFFFRDSGTIVTNHHVIKDAASITIFATDLNVYRQAEVVGTDPKMDLAVLRVRPVPEAYPLSFGSSDELRAGDQVFAIGNPFGYGGSVSSGILSAKGRTVGSGALSYLLQTDLPLNPGHSGGPLFNLKGEVIGINSANVVEAQGISFAIPAELANRRIQDLLHSGRPSRGWLGFEAKNLYDQPQFSPESYGVVVTTVTGRSPAARSGLRTGDIVRKIGSLSIRNLSDLEKAVLGLVEGQNISLEIYRAGQTRNLEISAAPAPSHLSQVGDDKSF